MWGPLSDERSGHLFSVDFGLTSAVSEFCGAHDHDHDHDLEFQVPVFISPRNRVAQL
jgi:hypothetical protein